MPKKFNDYSLTLLVAGCMFSTSVLSSPVLFRSFIKQISSPPPSNHIYTPLRPDRASWFDESMSKDIVPTSPTNSIFTELNQHSATSRTERAFWRENIDNTWFELKAEALTGEIRNFTTPQHLRFRGTVYSEASSHVIYKFKVNKFVVDYKEPFLLERKSYWERICNNLPAEIASKSQKALLETRIKYIEMRHKFDDAIDDQERYIVATEEYLNLFVLPQFIPERYSLSIDKSRDKIGFTIKMKTYCGHDLELDTKEGALNIKGPWTKVGKEIRDIL